MGGPTIKRSEIDHYIRNAETRFARAGSSLPEWGHWTPDQWRAAVESGARLEEIFVAHLGWDLTDFGLGDYVQYGLLLFSVRNGTAGADSRIPYAEKLMVVLENQTTPTHFHWEKTEDIINRSGGTLVVELTLADRETEELSQDRFTVFRDGVRLDCSPGYRLSLEPGQSITLYPWLYHSFWAEGADCVVGEVSSVNDDAADNRFLDQLGRFPSIAEDADPRRLLCTEYSRIR